MLIIDQFIMFLEEAGSTPVSFWGHKFYSARKSFISQLEEIKFNIKRSNKAAQAVDSLISKLYMQSAEIDELGLAELFVKLAGIFEKSGKDDDKIKHFSNVSVIFLNRAKLFSKYEKKRLSLLSREKDIKGFDKRLFENEGTFYCLNYYLAIYKNLESLKTIKDKKEFIEKKEINLGSGVLPGLKADFEGDEVLQKFILLILDDTLREEMLISYYTCKKSILDIDSGNDFEKELKKFIYYILLAFLDLEIKTISAQLLSPYGDNASVEELSLIFASYDK